MTDKDILKTVEAIAIKVVTHPFLSKEVAYHFESEEDLLKVVHLCMERSYEQGYDDGVNVVKEGEAYDGRLIFS